MYAKSVLLLCCFRFRSSFVAFFLANFNSLFISVVVYTNWLKVVRSSLRHFFISDMVHILHFISDYSA